MGPTLLPLSNAPASFCLPASTFAPLSLSPNPVQDFLFNLAVAICDVGSWGLTLVLLVVSIYYLVLYKLQNVSEASE